MFGSSPFGQSSSSPFGSQPAFGQTNNASSNPFAPKPFGSTSPFGAQTGGSIFGGMSTGVFGSQSSSALGSTSVFGASSSSAFGSSTPAFGASSSPAFGSSSPAFGSSTFGQKPAFGGFGTSTPQTSPFGSSFQQSQPAFGSNLFGSTPFGAPSQPAFGSSSSSFGAPSTPTFGSTSTPAFGSTASPTFGGASSGFGISSSAFGSSTPAFGTSSAPAFGAPSTPAFGGTSSPAFGATPTSVFGAASAPAFGSSTPGFGAPSTSAFNFGSSPAFGQTTSAFSSPFGAQSSAFGSQTATTAFGQSGFGAQRGGSRVSPYTPTPETDGATGTTAGTTPGKLESISAMPVYKDKSHEELRWEDYQLGDKGGPAPAGQSSGIVGFGGSAIGSSPTSAFGQTSANPFSATTSSNPFAPKPGFGTSTTPTLASSPFGTSTTPNPFGSTSSATPTLFNTTAQPFGASSSPSIFSSSTAAFGSPSIFGPTSTGTPSPFNTGLNISSSQSSPLFQSTTPSLSQTSSPFGQTSAFGQSAPGFGQSSLFSTSSGFGGGLFSSTPSFLSNSNLSGFSQTTPSLATPFQSAQQTQSSSGFNFSNFGQSQAAGTSGFGGTPGIFGQNAFGQSAATQSVGVAQAALVTNPFGTLPAMPQMSIGRAGTSSSVQYGISSLPVVEKPVPLRISSLLTSRHLSQRRIRLPVRKYHPRPDGVKVPFFNDDEETPSTPKADALFVPRENPRALVIRPLEQWPSRASEKTTPLKAGVTPVHENGKVDQDAYTNRNGHRTGDGLSEDSRENGHPEEQEQVNLGKGHQKSNGVHDDLSSTEKGDSYITLTGHRAGEAAIVYEHGADIEALMPKLRHSDYYTEPRIQELAAKERAEPGYCRHVRDFVVGRHGYGSIKFFGETDVRRLDLESLVQFNNREVIVYMDETKKPPIGQGLNKPAEVTLLNIKCFDKKTGKQYIEGPRIEKYTEMLRRKAEDQGAEFVSYDPVKGEWKFRVSHFSMYKLGEEDGSDDDEDISGTVEWSTHG